MTEFLFCVNYYFNGGKELAMQFSCVPRESGNVFKIQRGFTFTFESLCIYVLLHFYYVCLCICSKCVKKKHVFSLKCAFFAAFFVVTSNPYTDNKTKNDGTSQNPCF